MQNKKLVFVFLAVLTAFISVAALADSGSGTGSGTLMPAKNIGNAVGVGFVAPRGVSGVLKMYERYWHRNDYGSYLGVDNNRILEGGAISCRLSSDPTNISSNFSRPGTTINTAYLIDGEGNVIQEMRDQFDRGWRSQVEECSFDESKMNTVIRGNDRTGRENARQACGRTNCDFEFIDVNQNYIVGKINTVPFRH